MLKIPETKCYKWIPKELEKFLNPEIIVGLSYLLAKDYYTRIPLYVLFSETLNITEKDCYYAWNEETALWKRKNIKKLKKLDLLYVIDKCFKAYRRLIIDIFQSEEKAQPITTLLDDQLIISKNNNEKIVDQYIEKMISEPINFNPKNIIAIKGKKIIDLKTGIVRNRLISDYCTFEIKTEYNPLAKSELLDKILSEICLNDNDLLNLIEKVLGYSLTGISKEEKIFIFYGETSSGKSLLINLLQDTLGEDCAIFLNKNVVMNKKRENNEIDPFIHQLIDKRIGIINEIDGNDVVYSSKFKLLASNEKTSYRLLFSNEIQTTSSNHTLIISTVNFPKLEETHSIWRRIILIPFLGKFVEIPEKSNEYKIDLDLREKLKDSKIKEAFLTKIINASIKYNNEGFGIFPDKVNKLLKTFQKETNKFRNFCDTFLTITKNKKDAIGATNLWVKYKELTSDNISQKNFGKEIKKFLGESIKNGSGCKEYRGVKYS